MIKRDEKSLKTNPEFEHFCCVFPHQVEPSTGVLTTSICCLDRETTPLYTLQVVATDAGGLKGGIQYFFS